MSDETSLVPLPADITSLFEDERASAGLPAGARERLRSRIDLLGPIGGLGGGDGGAGSDGGAGGGGGAGAGVSGGAGAAGAAASGGALKGILASKIAIAAVAFGVGGASGAAVHATLAPAAAPAPALTTSASASPQPIASFAPPASASSSALSVDDLPNAAPKPSAKVTPASDPSKDGLKQERASLEVARTAITRGDYAGAIAALDRHAAAFPRGQLAEERELMRIQALVGQGRGPEAKAKAAQFHRDFPQSLMKGAVDATVRSIP